MLIKSRRSDQLSDAADSMLVRGRQAEAQIERELAAPAGAC
jgi:hypothetical protein